MHRTLPLWTSAVLVELCVAASAEPPRTSPVDAPGAAHALPTMLPEIADWLSHNFDLPRVATPPTVDFRPAAVLVAMRYRQVATHVSPDSDESSLLTGNSPEVLALYSDEKRTIYLAEGWSGATPAERSVLVHEMVHHMQNVAGLRYECPEAREKLAYEAQDRWLALSGTDLTRTFGLDPLTLLLRTSCLH